VRPNIGALGFETNASSAKHTGLERGFTCAIPHSFPSAVDRYSTMIIQPSEARELCSKSEWKLVDSSFSPFIEALSPSDLKSRIDRVSKLHRNCKDLINRQHSDSRKRTTLRKTELFAEAIGRFETSLRIVENEYGVEPPASKNIDSKTEETHTFNLDALRERADHEFENRKSEMLSALAARGEQQRGRSGEKRIQSRVGSVTRRQQGIRDTKNR
jgi:hypothetical protein